LNTAKTYSPLVTASDARSLMLRPDVVFIDARGGADAFERYKAGHLHQAVFVDLETQLSEKGGDAARGGRHPLPAPASVGLLLAAHGISPTTHVVVYDDKGGANAAARFWWMMKAAGHKKIQVLDGGYSAIIRGGLPVSNEIPSNKPSAVPYNVTAWLLPTVDMDTVAKARSAKDFLVVDVREAYRYRGESEPIDLVAGHIPGAVNIPYLDNLEADGRFRSRDALKDLYDKAIGGREHDKVVVHCGSGVTACHTLLAMEHADIGGACLYVGSWSEWSRNKQPVAIGDNSQ
jgi:thiosulfate/3-mercaptopyruvate sulfurtransferase